MGCAAGKRQATVQKFAADDRDFHDQYNIGRLLGSGAYGTIVQATSRDSGGECAAKVVSLVDRGMERGSSQRALKEFRSEYRVWARVGAHPNVVFLLESHEDDAFGYLVMELCHGSLQEAWAVEEELNEYTYARYFADMATSLQHIHSLGIVHRDVKHENFLLGGPDGRTVKLCDFGLSALSHDTKKLWHMSGTAPYMAPEVVTAGLKSGTASDVWSLGVIVYVAFFGDWPYSLKEMTHRAFCEAIHSGAEQPLFRPLVHFRQVAVSNVADELVRAMLTRNPHARCSAGQCLQMEYFLRKECAAQSTDRSVLSAISLQPALTAAIRRGMFATCKPPNQTRTLVLLEQKQNLAQTRLATSMWRHPSMCELQRAQIPDERVPFDGIFNRDQDAQSSNGLQEVHMLGELSNVEGMAVRVEFQAEAA